MKNSILIICLLNNLLFSTFGKPIQIKYYSVDGVKLTGYLPVDQQVYWVRKRPICHSGQSLIVPAAFTQSDLSIVGASIEFGKVINPKISPDLSGFCLIRNAKPWVINQAQMKVGGLSKWVKVGTSVFQQDLLIQDGKSVPISHAKSMNLWRALVLFLDRFEVVENDVNMRRDDFQAALLKIGAQQAIYLDMGSWSEGAYFSPQNRVVKIGKMRQNTHRQTNWLVFH